MKYRIAFLRFLLLLVLAVPGCSVARVASLYGMSNSEVPPAAGAKERSIDFVYVGMLQNQPTLALVHQDCPASPADTLQWYRDYLHARGWNTTKTARSWDDPPVNGESYELANSPYVATKDRQIGTGDKAPWICHERIELFLTPPNQYRNTTHLFARVSRSFVWDQPFAFINSWIQGGAMAWGWPALLAPISVLF